MADAYIYDAVRTPRGKGKKDGALHEMTALSLATQVLEQLRDRNNLDTSKVDDVVLGCVAPVGEQGSDIARTAVLTADYAETTAGVQVNRFCASGLEACNMAAAKVISGEADMAIGGGVESMSRVPMGRAALDDRPFQRLKTNFAPQGVGRRPIPHLRFSRDEVTPTPSRARARRPALGRKRSPVRRAGARPLALHPRPCETVRARQHADPGLAERLVNGQGEMASMRCCSALSAGRADEPRPHAATPTASSTGDGVLFGSIDGRGPVPEAPRPRQGMAPSAPSRR